ncbi:hypothetical protein [Dyella sp. 2HG41-7]|uniref:hypothetical protein n=1 Tax=Dyella sp. 2HG41-7 TaxID=2883239 RepID=UPI001F31B77C|nr:hypothetical protein [Dyella sp. 2HG41-7]
MSDPKNRVNEYFEFIKENYFAFALKNSGFERKGKKLWWRVRLDMVQTIHNYASVQTTAAISNEIAFKIRIGVHHRPENCNPKHFNVTSLLDFASGKALDYLSASDYLPEGRLKEKIEKEAWNGWYVLRDGLDVEEYVDKEIRPDMDSFVLPKLDEFGSYADYLRWRTPREYWQIRMNRFCLSQ